MAVSRALLAAPLLSLLLVSTATALVKPDFNEAIKTECNKAKDPKLCVEVLSAHPECNTDSVTGVAEMAMQVAAKLAREADVFARAKVAESTKTTPSACITYCVRDICSAAKKLEGVPDVITYGDWAKVGILFKHESAMGGTCGNGCPEKPTADEQAVLRKFTELKNALTVMRDLMQVRGNNPEEFPKGPPVVAP